MPMMPIEQANFLERMRQAEEERENRAKAENEMGKAADAFFKAQALSGGDPWGKLGVTESEYYNLAPGNRAAMSKGLILAQHYAEQESAAKLRTKQAEDTMEFYRNLPRQVGSRLTESALQRGLAGWRETLGEWSQPNATTPTPTDVRQLTSRYPGAGLDPVISRTVMGGMPTDEESQLPMQEGRTQSGTPYVRLKNTFMFDPGYVGEQRQGNALELADRRAQPRPVAPSGAKPVVLNGIHYLEDEEGNLFRVPQPRAEDPLTVMLRERLAGGGATNSSPAAVAPATNQTVMRFRKNPKTGKIEQY